MKRGETRSRLREIADEGIYRGSIPGTWAYFPVLLLALVGLNYHKDYPMLLSGFAVGWIMSGIIRLQTAKQALRYSHRNPKLWRWTFRIAIWLTPFLWGPFTALTLLLYGPDWDAILCLIVCAGLSGGGTAAFHADRVLHRGYVIGIWTPVALALLIQPHGARVTWTLVALIAVYVGYLLKLGGEQCARHWQALRDHMFTEQLSHLSQLLITNQSVPVLLDCLAQSVRPLVDWETVGVPGPDAYTVRLGSNPEHQVEFCISKPGGFTPEEQNYIQLFAMTASAALDRLQLFEEVERMARYDGLTGAANRRSFMEKADEMIRTTRRLHQSTPLSFLLFDVDHFKSVNDTYGHDVGDEVLVQVAARAKKALREIDVFARYGGEEFVAMLPGANLDEAARLVGERLRKAMADEPFATTAGPLEVTISIGVAQLEGEEQRLEGVLKRADEALYQAKKRGRNRVEMAEPMVALDPC